MTQDRLIIILNVVLMAVLAIVSFQFYTFNKEQGYFAQVPVNELHTMRVYEDGSFVIEYQDNTSEVGCLPEGLCND